MDLPFPDGIPFTLNMSESAEDAINFIKKYGSLFKITSEGSMENGEYIVNPDEVNVELIADNPDSIKLLGELLKEKSLAIPSFAASGNIIYEMRDQEMVSFDLTAKLMRDFYTKLKNALDDHNLYLKEVSDYNMSKIVNNYVMGSMYKIISNPVNLIEALTSVDGTTGPLKEVAEKNKEESILATKRTPGNFVNKAESINENLVGKEGIAVCATGLKTFFALSQYYNSILNNGSLKDLVRLLLGSSEHLVEDEHGNKVQGVKIKGKVYRLLANPYPKNVENVRLDILQELVNKGIDYDLALTLSALLSLATDNAKELALAKLNAGTKTIGMYIYGISIGMNFNELSDILMSPTGKMIASKLEGNVFSERTGFTNVDDSLLNYYDKSAYRLRNLAKTSLSDGTIIDNSYDILEKKILDSLKSQYKDVKNLGEALVAMAKDYSVPLSAKLLEFEKLKGSYTSNSLLTDVLLLLANEYFNSFIDEILRYLYEANTIFNSFEGRLNFRATQQLSKGAAEMKRLGRILSLNQGIKTKADELINLLNYFERAIYDITGDEADVVDIIRFVRDRNYRTHVINEYEKVKHSFNIYDVVDKVPHFNGYLKALATAKLENMESYSFRSVYRNSLIASNIVKGKEKDVIRGLYNYIDDLNISKYLRKFKFNIPAGNVAYNTQGDLVQLKQDVRIDLGTEWGRATYRKWFETEVIPKLKLGEIEPGKHVIPLASNEFIKDLTFDIRTNTVSHNPELVLTLPINMLPRVDAERSIFNKYKSEFNKLQGYVYKWNTSLYKNQKLSKEVNEMPLSDMFAIYAMIAHNWKLSENSLVPIFEDMNNSGVVKEYHDYISALDKSTLLLSLKRDTTSLPEDMLLYVVPIGSPWGAKSQYTLARDRVSRKYGIMEKQRRLSKEERELMSDEEYEALMRSQINGYAYISPGVNLNAFHKGDVNAPTSSLDITLDDGTNVKVSYLKGTHEFESIQIGEKTFKHLEFTNDGHTVKVTEMPSVKLEGQEIPSVEEFGILVEHMLNPCA